MKIQQTNLVSTKPSFSAKLSPTTLKALSREVEVSAKGNAALKKVLEDLKAIGNKETILQIGNYYKATEMVSLYHDAPDVEMEYAGRMITISNPLMPGVEHRYEEQSMDESLLKSIEHIIKYCTSISRQEGNLFENFVNKSKESPMMIFEKISPFLKGNKTTFTEIFNKAKDLNNKHLYGLSANIKDKQKELDALNKQFSEIKAKSDDIITTTEQNLNSDKYITERETLLGNYL